MYKKILFLLQIIIIGLCLGYVHEKPNWLQTCRLADPQLIKCSTSSVQELFRQLATGIDGLENVGKTDPLKINRIKILQGNGPVSVNASLSKVTVTGFSKATVLENQVSPKDYSWVTKLHLPKMRVEGNYRMFGRILVIPLNGKGKCFLEPKDMTITMYTKTKLYDRDEHVFYNVTSTRVEYTLKGLSLHFTNLFDGVKELEDGTNAYLNDNWPVVNDAMRPIIAKTIEDILLELLQKIFHNIPGDFFVEDLPRKST